MKKIVFRHLLGFSLLSSAAFASEFSLPGFVTEVEDGRLWVFKEGSPELEEFKQHGEPAKRFSNIRGGPQWHDGQGSQPGNPG